MAGVASLMAVNAYAADVNPYVSGKFIYSDVNTDITDSWSVGSAPGKDKSSFSDDVWGGSVAAGLRFDAPAGDVRTELELNLKSNVKKHHSGNGYRIKNNSLMLNAYYDIDTNSKFVPYVGGGIGYARLKGTVDSQRGRMSKSSTEFAWMLGAGVAYNLDDNVAIDLGYRYSDFGKISKEYLPGRNYKAELDANEVLLGVRYSFDK